MTAPGSRILKEFRLGLLLALPILIVMALLVFLPPDGKERAEWMQFIGRFHPLVVHFPIALVLLVPILELVGRSARFSYLRALDAASCLGWQHSRQLRLQFLAGVWGAVADIPVRWLHSTCGAAFC